MLLVHLSALAIIELSYKSKEDKRRTEPIYTVYSYNSFSLITFTQWDAIGNKRIQKLPETVNEPENELGGNSFMLLY